MEGFGRSVAHRCCIGREDSDLSLRPSVGNIFADCMGCAALACRDIRSGVATSVSTVNVGAGVGPEPLAGVVGMFGKVGSWSTIPVGATRCFSWPRSVIVSGERGRRFDVGRRYSLRDALCGGETRRRSHRNTQELCMQLGYEAGAGEGVWRWMRGREGQKDTTARA